MPLLGAELDEALPGCEEVSYEGTQPTSAASALPKSPKDEVQRARHIDGPREKVQKDLCRESTGLQHLTLPRRRTFFARRYR